MNTKSTLTTALTALSLFSPAPMPVAAVGVAFVAGTLALPVAAEANSARRNSKRGYTRLYGNYSGRNQPVPQSTPLNINTAGKQELSPIPVLSSDAKWYILNFRQSGPYVDGTDFASKVCSRVAVDFGATDILIGSTLYQGFKCLTVADGSYMANGNTHSYALPVEITGSDIIPTAPQ